MRDTEKDFLSTKDVGEKLGIGISQVQRLVKAGRLPHVRNGRRIIFPRPAWEAFVAGQTTSALAGMKGEVNAKTQTD